MLSIVLFVEKRRDNKNLVGRTGKAGQYGRCELFVAGENADELQLCVSFDTLICEEHDVRDNAAVLTEDKANR